MTSWPAVNAAHTQDSTIVCVRKDTTEKDLNMSARVSVVACMQSLDFQFKSFEEMDGVPRDKSNLLLDKFAQGCLRLKCEFECQFLS